MKKVLLIFVVLPVLLAGCRKEPVRYTEMQYRHRVDSMVREREPDLQEQFDTDLDRRMSIEVRPLADSLARP